MLSLAVAALAFQAPLAPYRSSYAAAVSPVDAQRTCAPQMASNIRALRDRVKSVKNTKKITSAMKLVAAAKVRRAQDYRVLKVKVGGASDLERLEAVRAGFAGPIRIDGNEGWDIDIARAITPDLVRLGIEFVEQPFHREDVDAYRAYRELDQRLPVILDESAQEARDVPLCALLGDGVNIKLSKTGGIRGGFSLARAARAHGLAVMIGCMIESELGIGQGAQIASLCDHVDLDGHLLIDDGPFRGLGFVDGVVTVSNGPGIGVETV